MRRRHVLSLPLCTAWGTAAHADNAAGMVSATPGGLPLLLTAPHGGTAALAGVPARTQGVVLRDAGTAELAEQVADTLQARTGLRPCLVIARFARKFLDANRSQDEAMASAEALPAYRAYHGQIAAYVAELRARHPQGALLLDVHGQSQAPATVFRGTRGGLTARRLLQKFGPTALQGEPSLIGQLAARGHDVHPAVGGTSLREDPRYSGGYTVATYGSQHAEGIDAIQLEFGSHQRNQPGLARDVAEALLHFMRHHGLLTP